MKKNFAEKRDMKLLTRQRVMLRAFAVNTILVLAVWGLTFIPALMYLSFLVAFYAIVSRTTSRTAAMAATLLVLLTPEMTSFSSLSGTERRLS